MPYFYLFSHYFANFRDALSSANGFSYFLSTHYYVIQIQDINFVCENKQHVLDSTGRCRRAPACRARRCPFVTGLPRTGVPSTYSRAMSPCYARRQGQSVNVSARMVPAAHTLVGQRYAQFARHNVLQVLVCASKLFSSSPNGYFSQPLAHIS